MPILRIQGDLFRLSLGLVASGHSTPDIAKHLYLSNHTVLNCIRIAREKLQAKTKLEAVLTAYRRGVL